MAKIAVGPSPFAAPHRATRISSFSKPKDNRKYTSFDTTPGGSYMFDDEGNYAGTFSRASYGWHRPKKHSKFESKPGHEPMRELVNAVTGNTYKVPESDVQAYLAFTQMSDSAENMAKVDKYVSDGFSGDFFSQKGCGHIKLLEYSPTAFLLRVTFWNNAVVVYFQVPEKPVWSELQYLADSGTKTWSNITNDYRHTLGVRFWDLVRVRGTVHEARFKFKYTQGGEYEAMRPERQYKRQSSYYGKRGTEQLAEWLEAKQELKDMGFDHFTKSEGEYARLLDEMGADFVKFDMLTGVEQKHYDQMSAAQKYAYLVKKGLLPDLVNGKMERTVDLQPAYSKEEFYKDVLPRLREKEIADALQKRMTKVAKKYQQTGQLPSDFFDNVLPPQEDDSDIAELDRKIAARRKNKL